MKVAAIQLRSVLDPKENLKTIRHFLDLSKRQNVEAIFLPECFYSLSDGLTPTPYLVEHQNEHFENIRKLASDFKIYILGGSAATNVQGKIYNRTYSFDPQGRELPSYDKMHLFSCNVPSQDSGSNAQGSGNGGRKILDESKTFTAGHKEQILEVGEFKIGLGICFDLRFPEMWRGYTRQGTQLLSVASAFTVPTGKAHWHTLLRARAIENQSYVIAAAQCGQNNERISTFGHSLIIGPWGEVLADAGEEEGLICADLDLSYVREVRSRMNVF